MSRRSLADDCARASAYVDQERLVQLTCDLVDISSPTGAEQDVARFLVDHLSSAGLPARLQEFEQSRFNVLSSLGDGRKGPTLMFNGHLDISHSSDESHLPDLPGYRAESLVEDGWIFGMGAHNMKGALAAYVVAVLAVQEAGLELDGEVLLAFVGGEIERHCIGPYQDARYRGGGCGTKHLLSNGGIAHHAVIGEPTGLRIVTSHVGSVAAALTVSGMPAPLRAPETGVDAIVKGEPVLTMLREFAQEQAEAHDYGGMPARVHVTALEGGLPYRCNRVPLYFRLCVEYRVLPNQSVLEARDAIVRFVQQAEQKLGLTIALEFFASLPSAQMDDSEPVAEAVSWAHELVSGHPVERTPGAFYSDASHLRAYGIPAVNYGPSGRTKSGKGTWDPELGEHVAINDLVTAARVYACLMLKICKSYEDGGLQHILPTHAMEG